MSWSLGHENFLRQVTIDFVMRSSTVCDDGEDNSLLVLTNDRNNTAGCMMCGMLLRIVQSGERNTEQISP